MHHRAVVKLGTHDNLPYNIQCACGTGGDFGGKEEAMNWMQNNHFRFLQGVNTAEFADETPHTTDASSEEETKLEPTPPEATEPEKAESA